MFPNTLISAINLIINNSGNKIKNKSNSDNTQLLSAG